MTTNQETAPLLAESRPVNDHNNDKQPEVHYQNVTAARFWCLLSSIIAAWLLVNFDGFFMASSHPVITSYFNASYAASWLTTVFFLSSTIFGPLYGRISDVVGRRSVYLFAFGMFAVTTAWCGAATSIESFIAARFFCGLGAGGVMGMSGVILSDIVKVRYRGIYQSYANAALGLGSSSGAALGGLICEKLGWRAAFYLQLPLIVVLIGFAYFATPAHLGPSLARAEGKTIMQGLSTFDFSGAFMLTLCLSGFILGINLGGSLLPWNHPVVIVSLITFVITGVGLVVCEKRAVRPLLPIHLLSTVPYANLNWGNLLGSALSTSSNFNIPLFLQAAKLQTPTESGILLLPSLVGGISIAVIIGFVIAKTGRLRPYIAAGVIIQLLGTLACALLNESVSILAIVPLIPWVIVGQGLWFPTTTVATLAMTEGKEQAVIVTTLGLSRSLGAIFGVAYSSWILQNALLIFLPRCVTGSDKTKSAIIKKVRSSVRAISTLDPMHQREGESTQYSWCQADLNLVTHAYALSLRTTFLGCACLGLIACIIVLPARVSRLKGDESTIPEPGERTIMGPESDS